MSIFDTAATNQEPVIQPTAEELEQKKKDDSINPDFYLLGSKKWSEANNPVVRSEYASKITEKIRGVYSADKSLTVKNRVMREGKLVEEDSPAYDQKGNVTPEGESYFEKMEIYLKTAAAHETGGVRDNPFTGKKMVENGLSDIREEPRRNPIQFPDYADFERSEKEKIRGEGEEPNFGIGSYSRWRFQKDGKLSIDVLDDEVIKAFEDQKAFIEFDPKSFNKDEKFRMVGGFPKFNEDFLGDRQGVTDEILALEGVSGARKSEFLKEFAIESEKPVKEKMAFEKEVMDILTQNDRSSSSALKSLGDDNGDTRVLEDSWDGVKNTAGTILAVLEPTLQALGLANEGSLNLLERESFDPALRGGDLIKAYEDRLKSGDSTSASHAVVMGELIDKFRAKGIVDGVEMGNIMRDVVKKNVWAKGDPDKVRQLNDGEIVFNPSSISARSPDEVHNAIKAQNTTAEKKEALTREYDFRRSYFASVLNDQLVESDNDYKEHRKQMEASGVSDPSKILYSWKGLEDGFGGSYGWTGTTGNAIWDPLAQAGRGIANAGWSGLAMASSAASEGAGKLGLEGISNWLKASTVGSVNQIQENEMLTARDESLAALRGERNGTRAVIKDIATSGLQMIPMFVGGAAGGAIKATAGANKGVAMLGTSVQSLGVFGYAGLQGVQSIYETAIMKGEQKAMQEGRKMSEDERYGVIADNWKPALVNGIQTAMLTKLLSGSGTQRMALGKLGAGGQGITIRELASQFKNTVGKSGWSKATVRASLAELKPEIGKLTATLIHDVAGETIEETLNQVFEGFITKATLNPDKSYNDIAGEAIVAGLEGGFLGGAIPAGKSAMFGNDKSAHQNAIKYAMMQQYQEKLVALDKAGNTDPNANSSGDLLDHFNFVADKTKAYQKLRKEKNYSGAEAINVEIDQATKVLSEKLGVETVDPKAYERFAGNKMAPALAAIMSTDQIPHEVKEQALLDAARGEDSPLLLHSVDVDSEASAPPVVDSEAPLAEAPPVAKGEARTGGVVDVLSKLGYNPGKNREFVETPDAPVFDKPVKFGNVAIEAITVGSQPFAGARVTTTLPDGTKEVTHVSSAEALEMVPEKGKFDFGRKNSAILREGFTNAAENHESNIKEWSKDGITKPAAAATSATAEAAKKDGAPIAPAGGTTITPPSAKAASSVEENPLTKAKAEVAAATDEELAVHATTPISGSMNFHRGEAVDRLKAEGKWDEKNNKPLFKAGQPVAYENSKGETVDGVFSGYDSDGAKAIVSVGDKTHRGAVSKLRAISLPKESSTPSIEPSSAESSASPAPKAPTPSLPASLKEALKASSVPASELTKATESYYGQSEESSDEIQAGVAKRLESDEEVMKHITVKGTEKKGTIIADYGNPAGPHEIEYSSKKEKASALERAKETIRDGRPMFEMFDVSRGNMDAYHAQLRAKPIIPLAPPPAIIPKAPSPIPAPTPLPTPSVSKEGTNHVAETKGMGQKVLAAIKKVTTRGSDVFFAKDRLEAEQKHGLASTGKRNTTPVARAFMKPDGSTGIVLFPAALKLSEARLEEVINHEIIHLEQFKFEATEEGRALAEKAGGTFDKNSPEYDEKFDSFMRKEYPSWDKLPARSKVREASRAAIEAINKGETSHFKPGFFSYLKGFLDHLSKVFSKDSSISSYIESLQANLAESSAESKVVASDLKLATAQGRTESIPAALSALTDGGKVEVKARPAAAGFEKNQGQYKGDAHVWSHEGKVYVDPSYVASKTPQDKQALLDELKQKAAALGFSQAKEDKTLNASSSTNTVAGADILSNSAVQTDPLAPMMSVESDVLEGKTKSPFLKGAWSKDGDTYYYTPEAMTTLPLGRGTLIAIRGSDEVLVMNGVVNGVFTFTKLNFARVAEMESSDSMKRVAALSRNWNNTLMAKVAPHFLPVLQKMVDGELSKAETRKLLHEVMKIVAPGRSVDSIAEADLPKGKFFQAFRSKVEISKEEAGKTKPDADGKYFKFVPGVRVDYRQLASELSTLVSGHKMGDAAMDTLVALDASRQLATWMGEENIHTLTLDPTKFSEQEIEEFYTAINNDPSHPFHDLLKVTAQEQFPDSESLDPEDNGEGYAYTVASEMLRKLQQIRQTGSTSEINAAYATSLIAAINDNKITAKFKTTIALVKRFFERMRRMLYLSQQMGEITPAQKELLGRLNDEYLKAGFNEDVDQIKAKKREEVSLLANTYIESTRADIDKVAMKRSQPLLKLREVTDEVFENIGIRGLVMVDAETGALTLNPIATGYLEENHPDFDTKAIQDALDELSENDSFKKSLTQSFFLDEVAKARLAELSFDPAELYDWIGGKADINPNGVISHVLAGAPSEQRYGVVMDYLQEALEDMQQERALKVSLMHLKARATFAKLDMSKPKDVRRALAIAVKMGLESTTIPRDPNAVQIGTEQWKQWVMAQAYRPLAPGEELKDLQLRTSDELLARSTGEKGFLAVEALTERIDAAQAKLEALRQLDEDVSKEESDAVVRGKIDRMRQEATLLDDNARAAGRSHSKEAVVMRLKAQFMTAELGKDKSIASARYAQFSGYMQALKDYNESIDGVLHRAIGRNNPDNREFGLHYQDTSFNINKQIAKPNGKVDKGSKSLPLGPITATAPVATTPNEVFGFNVNNPAEEKSNAELIGYGNPRYSKASDGARRELVDAHYRAVFGNAKLRGRHAKNWFMLQDALGNIAMDMANRDDFFQTAGFNLEAQFNEKLELRKFETPHQAFPGLNLYDRLFFVTEKMRDREQAQSPGKDFAEVVSILKETKEWADGIRSKINQDGAILEINGEQTLAGASKLLLDARLRDFDLAMRNFEATLNPLLNRFFRGKVNEFGSDDGFMMNEGGLISKTTTSEGLYEAFNQSLNSFDKFGASSIMVQAMSSLNTAVKLTRRSLQAFQDKNWQDNMEHEMHRTLSDYAYVPDHKELLQLREQKLDPSVMRNLGWIMRFYNKGKGYSVGSLHAYELINEQLKGEWSNDGKLLVTKHTRPLRANNMVSEDELGNLSMDDEASGLSAIADLENGGHTPLAFATGEQGNTRDSAINEKVGETQSTAEGRNQREVMTPYQIQRNWLTRSLMFLGYGRGRGEMGSADNAREFAFEVIKQAEGTSKMEFYELMKKGLAGAFTMVDPSSEAFESLVERFVATNPEWNFAFGQRSEGPFQSEAAKEMYDKLGNDPFQFDPETFASDILRFKATFETDAIEKIRIGEGSKLTQVYESILSFATMDHANEQLNADNPNFNLNSDGAPSLTLPSEMNEQTASWARAFKYDMNNLGGKGGSKIGLFDARALEARKDMEGSLVGVDDVLVSEGLFVDNPALGVLLQNEPGENVFVYVPSVKAMKQFDLRHGVKVMSYNGMTVIVTPQGVRSSREEIKEALRGSMLRHASSSPEATAAINGLAARTMEMFSPVFRAQQLLAGLKDERQSIIDLAIHHPAYTGSSEQIAQTDDNIRQMLKQRLSRHMVKTARLFSSNGLAMRNTSFMGRVEKGELVSDRLGPKVKGQKNIRSYATESSKLPNINQDFQNQLEDNVDFLSNVLTDPQFKEMYNAAFLGTDEIENNNLSDTTNVQMFGAIHGILNTLDSDEEGFGDEVQVLKDDEHQEDAERAQEEATREREAKETAMEELIDQLAEDMGAEVKSDGTILDPEDSSVSPNPDSVNDLLKSIGALVADDARKEQERFKLNGEEHVVSPGDAALFNMFSTIVTSAKEKLADVDLDSLLVEGESPKRMLDNLADPGSLGGPIIRTINRPIRGAENDIVAAGDWVNITRASHAGHTSQTIAFAFSRQSKMRAGLLAQLDSVKAIMDKAAAAQIKKDLQKDPRRVEHATVKINIPLTTEFIEEMDKATDGLMTKHIEESKAMVSSLYFDQARFEKGLREITAKIESLKAAPDENDAALNLFLDSVKDWHEVGINTMVATLKSQIRSAIEENHYEGSTRQAARVLRQQILRRVDSDARLKALKESAQTKLKEIERLASLQFHQMNSKEGEKDSSLTVPLKLAVEAFNGTMESFEKSLRQVVKEGLGAKDSAGVKINLSLPRATWSKTMSPQDMAKLKKALNQGVSVGALNEVIKEVQLSRTAQSAAANLSHGKGSKSFAAIIKRMVEVYDESGDAGLSKEFNTLLDQLANDGGDTSNQAKGQTPVKGEMRELLRHFVLNDEEAKAMFLAGAQTTTQRNQLMKAEQFRETIKRALADTNKSIQTILKTKDGQQLGRYHHDITAGLAKGVDPVTRQITSVAIPPSNRQVPISMRLVPSSYEASTQLGSSLVEEQTNFMENEAQRIDFYAKREGVLRALSEFSAGPLESAFKKIRGSTEQFSKFNPFEMVKQSIALVNIEKAIISESMEEAKKLATAAEQRGMTIEAIAILSDPANGKEMYTVNQQKRVAFYKTPKGFSERSKLIGHLFDDGKPVILMSQNARQNLIEAFPAITKHTVDSSMNEIALDALSVRKAVAAKNTKDSYMLEFTKSYVKGKFQHDGFSALAGKLDANGNITREDAANAFVAEFKTKIQNFVEDNGKNPLVGLRDAAGLRVLSADEKLDMTNPQVEKVINLFSDMIRKIVYSSNHKEVSKDADKKIRHFLLSLSEDEFDDLDDPTIKHPGFSGNEKSMMDFDLMGTFSTAFSEIEGQALLKRLMAGLSVHGGWDSPMMMKYLHGQDSRIRARFLKNHVAHDTAIHLQAFLELGFNGESGRENAETQIQDVRAKLADSVVTIGKSTSAGLVKKTWEGLKGVDSLDASIAKDIATLEGIKRNRGMGVKVGLEVFRSAYLIGYKGLLQYDLAQRSAYKNFGSKFFNSKHIQLTDDIPMAKEKDALLRPGLLQIMANMGVSNGTPEADEAEALKVIDGMIANLLKGRKNAKQIKDHADLVEKEMRGINDAMALSRAVLSKPATTPEAEAHNQWKHDAVTPFQASYSSVPLSFAYAAGPGNRINDSDAKYIADPALISSIAEGSIYGGPGRDVMSLKNGRAVYRPLQVNGITSVNSLIEDSIYRMNVAPNYEVLRRLVGRVSDNSGIPVTVEAQMITNSWRNMGNSHDAIVGFGQALAAVATELESNLQNDAQQGVDSTRFAKVMDIATTNFIVRALGSPWQLVNQTAGPTVAVFAKKLLTLQVREATDFAMALSKIVVSGAAANLTPDFLISNQQPFKSFNQRLNNFTREVSIFVNKRGFDGTDNTKNVVRHQVLHGSSVGRQVVNKIGNEVQAMGESILDHTIGASERVLGRAVFAMELMSELRQAKALGDFTGTVPSTLEELMSMKSKDIPTLAKARARIKVSDLLGQGDQAKKSSPFQNHSNSPTFTAVFKSISRFSSQQSSTAANVQVFGKALYMAAISKALHQENPDLRVLRDAVENIAGTITQNVLFHVFKVHTIVPLVLYLFNGGGGDEQKRSSRRAQMLANKLMAPSEEGVDGSPADFLKSIFFGPKKEFFRLDKNEEASKASAFAGLLSKAMTDMAAAAPSVGVTTGFSSTTEMWRWWTNKGAIEIMASKALGYDLKMAQAYHDKNSVGIDTYDSGFLDSLMSVTAPTALLSDYSQAAKRIYKGMNTPSVTPLEIALNVISEAVPITPEFRRQTSKEIRDKVKMRTPKKDVGRPGW